VLGSATAVAPSSVRSKVVVFLPPVNAEGALLPEVWRYQELLGPYVQRDTALAIVIAGLELLPPRAVQQLRAAAVVPQVGARPRDYPPVLLVHRLVAAFLLNNDIDDVSPGFVARHLGHDIPNEVSELRYRVRETRVTQAAQLLVAERRGARGVPAVLLTAQRGTDLSPTWLSLAVGIARDSVLASHPVRLAIADSGALGQAALSLAMLEEDGPRRRLHAHVHVAPALDPWVIPPCQFTVRRSDLALTIDPSVPLGTVLRILHATIAPPASQPVELERGVWSCPTAPRIAP